MADKKQQLVLAIIDFLSQSIEDGTVRQDDQEGLEVAIQCIAEAFGVDPTNKKQCEGLSIKPASLTSIFEVFLKTQPKPSPAKDTQEPDRDTAEKHKTRGNELVFAKQYDEAIDAYTAAISSDATNPVYFSNRAAAYSSKGDHASAVSDAKRAIEVDATFVKAYSRLGHAHFSLGDFQAAKAAFKNGLELDPSNDNLKLGLQSTLQRLPADEPADGVPRRASAAGPAGANLSGLADMLRGAGGAGGAGAGAGGMPDLASMMNNPEMMQMAQQLMANGGLERLMGNPAVANMMNRVQSGGGLPSMEELMSNPTLQNLAQQFGPGARPPP